MTDWMDEWKLRAYQRAGLEFLAQPPEFHRGRILADPRGFGKALALDTPIPTPIGWTTMGTLRIGDAVFDEKGQQCNVTGTFELYAERVFDVVFRNGEVIRACGDHQWFTWTKKARNAAIHHERPGKHHGVLYGDKRCETLPVVVNTLHIKETLRCKDNGCNHSIPLTQSLACARYDFPVHPYVMGLWLGDGHTREGAITVSVKDMFLVKQLADLGYEPVVHPERNGCHKVTSKRLHRELRDSLLSIRQHAQKFIPPAFLRSSADQRQALLEGLMDSDGTVSKYGSCCFDNTNQNLAEAVRELVVSLGGKGTMLTKQPKVTGRPEAVCAPCWRFIFTPNFFVFRLPRKIERQSSTLRRETQKWHYIAEVNERPREHMKCITVDAPSSLYLASRSMIPTHNTRQALGMVRLRKDRGAEGNVTPIVTTAISRGDWRREITRVWPTAAVAVLCSDEPKYKRKSESEEEFEARVLATWLPVLRGTIPGADHHFPIVSFESVPKLLRASVEYELIFDTLIVDEAHRLKKYSTRTSQSVRPLVAKTNVTALITGTPVHNRPHDLYNLLDTCKMGYAGSFKRWADRYFFMHVTAGGYGRVVGDFMGPSYKSALVADTSTLMLSRSVKEAYGELPAVQRILKRLSPKSEVFRVSPAKVAKMKEGGTIDEALRACAAQKLKYAAELCEELGEPVVVYTYKREHARQLMVELGKLKIGALLATGDVVAKKRDEVIERWKGDDDLGALEGKPPGSCPVLVCTMDAVNESATLVRAACMVFCDFDWRPMKQLQCEGRIDPARQPENERRPVSIYYLCIEGGADEVVAERQYEKLVQAQGIAGTGESTAALSSMLKPLAKNVTFLETVSEEQSLADLVTRLEARASRIEEVGLWTVDDKM